MPEHEYDKLRKEFYAKREQNNFHNVDYSWLDVGGGGGDNNGIAPSRARYTMPGSPNPGKKYKQSSSSTVYCNSLTPLELFQT